MTTHQKIQSLTPGRSIELSHCNGIRVIAERSGDGKTLQIVRETTSGFNVIKTERW